MTLRFGTYTEFQSEPHGDHPKIIWDHIEVGVQADQLGFDVFTCLEHPWFEQFAIMTDPLAAVRADVAADAQHPLPRALPHAAPCTTRWCWRVRSRSPTSCSTAGSRSASAAATRG